MQVSEDNNRLINFIKCLNGKTNEVATTEDLVSALSNNLLAVDKLAIA